MSNQDIAQQISIENGMLKHITEALRLAVGWQMQENDLSRKLSTVRFISQSLQRHLEHLMTLEEHDGYMDMVVEQTPHLARLVDGLRKEHDQLRRVVNRLVHRLERASPSDHDEVDRLCEELIELVDKLDEHNKKETALLQEAMARDGGGEG
jgi:hemerythrin-like domain-containing protein